jgi:hypothetical protein
VRRRKAHRRQIGTMFTTPLTAAAGEWRQLLQGSTREDGTVATTVDDRFESSQQSA